ncbi:MAG TPA: hypothetical protein DDX33_06400 [Rikenellaceae bacterium]|nr:hypothetical protein [Rikenellaceae bacterium]
MRHSWLTTLMIAAVLFDSCTKHEDNSQGQAIGFSASTVAQAESVKATSIGTPTTDATLKSQSFGIYGLYSTADGGTGANVFDYSAPVEVKYTTDKITNNTCWTYTFDGALYTEKKYWKRNMYYRFRAYHPYSANVLQAASTADGLDIEYRVMTDQYDLLVASAKSYPANEGYERVTMTFNHALCALKFKIAFKETVTPPTYTDNIVHFYITGLDAYGHLDYEGFGDDEVLTWEGKFNSRDRVYEWTGSKQFGVKTGNYEPIYLMDEQECFFAIPQKCSDPSKGPTSIHLFTQKSGGTDGIDHTVNLEPLEWKAGMIYTYTLLVNKSDIEVSVSIEPWLTKQVPIDIYL